MARVRAMLCLVKLKNIMKLYTIKNTIEKGNKL